jgi:hypothetical protein
VNKHRGRTSTRSASARLLNSMSESVRHAMDPFQLTRKSSRVKTCAMIISVNRRVSSRGEPDRHARACADQVDGLARRIISQARSRFPGMNYRRRKVYRPFRSAIAVRLGGAEHDKDRRRRTVIAPNSGIAARNLLSLACEQGPQHQKCMSLPRTSW